MKKLFLLFAFVAVLTSCGGVAAGIINRGYINENSEKYVAVKVAERTQLQLTEEQVKMSEDIYFEEITDLKANAHREKTKEISNKASLNNIRYYWFRSESKFQNILTPSQLSSYLKNDSSAWDEKDMAKEYKLLKKMGYDVDFQ